MANEPNYGINICFNSREACMYSINGAIMLYYFRMSFAQPNNPLAKEINGYIWYPESLDAMLRLMPFMTRAAIRSGIDSLINHKVLFRTTEPHSFSRQYFYRLAGGYNGR